MTCRYLYTVSHSQMIVITLPTHTVHKLRTVDFQPIHPACDPAMMLEKAFAARKLTPPPAPITVATPPPSSVAVARRYPDASEWAQAQDSSELALLEDQNATQCLPPADIPSESPPDRSYDVLKIQAGIRQLHHRPQSALIYSGGQDVALVHFYPPKTAGFTAYKAASRLLFATAADICQLMRHLDIK